MLYFAFSLHDLTRKTQDLGFYILYCKSLPFAVLFRLMLLHEKVVMFLSDFLLLIFCLFTFSYPGGNAFNPLCQFFRAALQEFICVCT